MEFKKYNSIENSYRGRHVNKFTDLFDPSVETFVGLEKLDGANIQLVFTPDGEMKVGKRTSFLLEGDNFFDIWNTLKRYDTEVITLKQVAKDTNKTYIMFGEIYGPGINGRVDYGPEKQIAFFDLYIDDVLMTHLEMLEFVSKHSMFHMLPKICVLGDFDKCMSFDVENMHRPKCEGIVIKPTSKNIFNHQGERLILKKKSKAFEDTRQDAIDKGAGRAEPKEEDLVYKLNSELKRYITENRIIDIFAKHGKIESPKQIGEYIKLVSEDAKIDFHKDYIIPDNLNANQIKRLYDVNFKIVGLLKQHM